MANARFTRDEVILTLDVLYSSGGKHLQPNAKEIVALSKELNQLPVYPKTKRPANFRNCVGVSHQIERFLQGYSDEKSGWNVGELFFRVDYEFEGQHDSLHDVAQAIRRNAHLFSEYQFGDEFEDDGFPEGVILGHLHRLIEKRDSKKIPCDIRCDVCKLEPKGLYKDCGIVLEHHLIVSPADLDWKKTYSEERFITVCPNCHKALHMHRPWIEKGNFEEIFQ